MKEFDLEGHEFIALNQLLKMMALVEPVEKPISELMMERFLVNDAVELQRRKKLRSGDKVIFHDQTIIIK